MCKRGEECRIRAYLTRIKEEMSIVSTRRGQACDQDEQNPTNYHSPFTSGHVHTIEQDEYNWHVISIHISQTIPSISFTG